MRTRATLMMFTAATALSANAAFGAINPEALAASYLADGYAYVEVKVGPTRTKLEAVKGDRMIEVVYDNVTGGVITREFEWADDDYIGLTGIEIATSDDDFEDDEEDDEEDDDEEDDEEDDDEGDDEGEDSDESDEGDEGEGE